MIRQLFTNSLLFFFLLLAGNAYSQSDWKLVKDNGWIKVYESNMEQSSFKRVKVQCTMEGTFEKLIEILHNVENHKTWIYKTKSSHIIKRVSPTEYYYYTESGMPWPIQNRDAVVHIKFFKDTVNRTLKIVAVGVPDYIASISGKIRVPRSANTWHVSMNAENKLDVSYVFEADPGGSLPAVLVNALVDKGPYESFKKLAEQLKR
ncbi:MAG: lipid-binding protein [Gammaproteobacteria bacterium]|nr:MAG: lipid-binding protein [Gammaproteobacteria bacterium]